MQLKFDGSATLDVLVVNAKQIYTQGAQRDVLEIQLVKGALPFDTLDALTADSTKTSKLTLIDGDNQFIHDNYSIRAELAIKPIVTAAATSTTQEVTEDRLCITLAQLTYAETQQAAMQTQIDALTLASLGV